MATPTPPPPPVQVKPAIRPLIVKPHTRTLEAKIQLSKLKKKLIKQSLTPIPEVPETRTSGNDLAKSWHLGRFGVHNTWNFEREKKALGNPSSSMDKETKRILRSLLRQPPSKMVFRSASDVLGCKTDGMSKLDFINKSFDTMRLDQQIRRRERIQEEKSHEKVLEKENKNKEEQKSTEDGKNNPAKKEMATLTEDIKRKQELLRPSLPFSFFSFINRHRRVKTPINTGPYKGSSRNHGAGDTKVIKIKKQPSVQGPPNILEQLKNRQLNKAELIGKWGDILHIEHHKPKDPEEPKIVLILKTPFHKLPKKPITKSAERVICPMCEEEKRAEKLRGKNTADSDDSTRKEKSKEVKKSAANKKKLPVKKEHPKLDPELKELRKSRIIQRMKLSAFESPVMVEMRDIGTSTPTRFFPSVPIKKFQPLEPKKAEAEAKQSKEVKDYIYTDDTYASIARIKKNTPATLRKIIRRAEKAVGTEYGDFRPRGSHMVFKGKNAAPKQEFTYNINDFPDILSSRKVNVAKTVHKKKVTTPSGPTVKTSRKRNTRQKTESLCVNC